MKRWDWFEAALVLALGACVIAVLVIIGRSLWWLP